MEAEDLLVLHPALAALVDAIAPVGEALVQGRPVALQQSAVGGIADEDVREPVDRNRLFAKRRANELFLRECVEADREASPDGVRHELLYSVVRELEADHGGYVDHGALLG